MQLLRRAAKMFARVFPRCSMISQAIAFNLFVAFFPTLLLVVAIATSPLGSRTDLLNMITDFTRYLPPGSRQIVSEFLIKRAPQAWKWAVFGWAGTLLAGSQVMKLIMEGVHTIYGDAENSARIMALVVHPYIMGVPHRLKYFRRIFETIRKKSDVAFMTGEQILDWYLSVGPKAP